MCRQCVSGLLFGLVGVMPMWVVGVVTLFISMCSVCASYTHYLCLGTLTPVISPITFTGGSGYSVFVYSQPFLQYGTQSSTPFC